MQQIPPKPIISPKFAIIATGMLLTLAGLIYITVFAGPAECLQNDPTNPTGCIPYGPTCRIPAGQCATVADPNRFDTYHECGSGINPLGSETGKVYLTGAYTCSVASNYVAFYFYVTTENDPAQIQFDPNKIVVKIGTSVDAPRVGSSSVVVPHIVGSARRVNNNTGTVIIDSRTLANGTYRFIIEQLEISSPAESTTLTIQN